jgi:hypothetical protein
MVTLVRKVIERSPPGQEKVTIGREAAQAEEIEVRI